jgi:hypothetical protein
MAQDDIGHILSAWPYDPKADLIVRKIERHDGGSMLQLRVDVGLLQMEMAGRPDGSRPHEMESLLDYHLAMQSAAERADQPYKLDKNEVKELRRESLQYYYRRICLLKLGDYNGVKRDAEHNLAIMSLIRDHARDKSQIAATERYRPYVTMHRIQAQGFLHLERGDYHAALKEIEGGVSEIEAFYQGHSQDDIAPLSGEIKLLQGWADEIRRNIPPSPRERLERELEEAIETEDYERAAEINELIKRLAH